MFDCTGSSLLVSLRGCVFGSAMEFLVKESVKVAQLPEMTYDGKSAIAPLPVKRFALHAFAAHTP